jgi:hypothetical protein
VILTKISVRSLNFYACIYKCVTFFERLHRSDVALYGKIYLIFFKFSHDNFFITILTNVTVILLIWHSLRKNSKVVAKP